MNILLIQIRDVDEQQAQCRRRRRVKKAKKKANEIWEDATRQIRSQDDRHHDSERAANGSRRGGRRNIFKAMGAHVPIDDTTQYRLGKRHVRLLFL